MGIRDATRQALAACGRSMHWSHAAWRLVDEATLRTMQSEDSYLPSVTYTTADVLKSSGQDAVVHVFSRTSSLTPLAVSYVESM
jgi:hypothetical protein